MNMVTGLTMLMLALFALPALMKFIAPMVAATAGGPVGVAVVAGVMAVKKGAEMVGDAAKAGVSETIDNDAMDEGPSGSG
jgi:molybdenum cofactor biosynthesis enzyme